MSNVKGTGWIQNLNKSEIIAELKKRNVSFDKNDLYNNLRELLRKVIKESDEIDRERNLGESIVDKQDVKENIVSISTSTPGITPSTEQHSDIVNKDDYVRESSSTEATNETNTDESDMAELKLKFQMDDDWELFEEKLECYFITKNITDDKIKVATLVTCLSNDAHALLKQLVAPVKITAKKYEENMKMMSKQLNPKPSEAMERCTFHIAKQEHNESIADFLARLKKLALYCNFEKLNDALKDQLVCGMSDKDTKIKLFEEKSLTLEKAVEIAIAREAAVKNATTSSNALDKKTPKGDQLYAMQGGSRQGWQRWRQGSERVNNAAGRYSRTQQHQRQNQRSSADSPNVIVCYCCGKKGHVSRECRFRDYICNTCQKKGHLSKVCKNESKNENRAPKPTTSVKKIISTSETCDKDISNFFMINQFEMSDGFNCKDMYKGIYINVVDEHSNVNTNMNVIETQTEHKHVTNCNIQRLYNHASVNSSGKVPMFEKLNINGKDINFEIDTGTYASVISEKIYNEYFADVRISKTSNSLRA